MTNSVTFQTLEEGPRNIIVKAAGVLDTSDYSLNTFISMASSNQGGKGPTPTQVRIDHIDYSVSDQLEVQLWWDATSDVIILPLAGRGRMSFWNFGGLVNNAGAGKTGDVLIKTTGYTSGIQVFSIILECVKQGPDL
jgi:hypothetical protein